MTTPSRNRLGGIGRSVCLAMAGVAFGCGTGGQQLPKGEAPRDVRNDSSVVLDRAMAAGLTLEIHAVNGACVLRSTSAAGAAPTEVTLAPKAPCHFLRVPGGTSPQVRAYQDVGTEGVLIVSGTPASEAARARWKLEPGLVCGEESQGILIRKGAMFATRSVRRGGISCRDQGVDEKEYWAFAHDE
jgi:hypothetical protein